MNRLVNFLKAVALLLLLLAMTAYMLPDRRVVERQPGWAHAVAPCQWGIIGFGCSPGTLVNRPVGGFFLLQLHLAPASFVFPSVRGFGAARDRVARSQLWGF